MVLTRQQRQSFKWLTAIAFVGVLVFSPLEALAQSLDGLTQQELEEQKLREEIKSLKRESRWWNDLLPVLPALVAAGGFVIAVFKYFDERKLQRHQDKDKLREETRQQEADRLQRSDESRRRFDETFTRVVTSFGSGNPAVEAGATVSLLTFLRPKHSEFHSQVFMFLLTNLKREQDPEVRRLLTLAFEEAIRLQLASKDPVDRQRAHDLARVRVPRVDLSELDLTDADIAFADLKGANLRKTILFRAKGIEVVLEHASLTAADLGEARLRQAKCAEAHFHEAKLGSAHLEDADLTRAEFQQAKLQSAHLEGATITGAKFEGANLNDTYFLGARGLDQATLHSLSRAIKWDKAHFDEGVAEMIKKNK